MTAGTGAKPKASSLSLLGALAGATALAFLISLAVGPSGLGFGPAGEAGTIIFREIRLPRALLGALVGGALGLAGAALQGYLRNPLAEPSLVGVSGGAALGAVLAIHLGLAAVSPWRCRSAGSSAPRSPCWRWWRWPACTAAR